MPRMTPPQPASAADQMEKRDGILDQEDALDSRPVVFSEDDLLSTGSLIWNLSLSGSPVGGWCMGTMGNLIGDSSSGKTFAALTAIAEAANCPRFDDYDLRFDNAESINKFNMDQLFGKKMTSRMMGVGKNDNSNSTTIEAFEYNILRCFNIGRPFIYVLDSFDAISDEAEMEKEKADYKAAESGKEKKGTYGMAKAKQASSLFRRICDRLEKSKSFLLVISQTRDNTDPYAMNKRVRAGGKALKFYSAHEMWMIAGTKITRTIREHKMPIGINSIVKISKNKLTGRYRECEFPIYYDLGIDDIQACLNWLVEWKYATSSSGKVVVRDLDLSGGMEDLIEQIEDDRPLRDQLHALVTARYQEIETKLRLERRPRYE